MSSFTNSIQHSIGSPTHSNPKRRNKKHPNWKRGSKTVPICRWLYHDSVHGKSYRLYQKTTWPNKWIWQNSWIQSQYSEMKGIFLHQQWNIRNRNQEIIPLDIARKIKPRINHIQEVKDLYSENYTTVKKDIKEDTKKCKHISCSWNTPINIIKISILPKSICKVKTILIKTNHIFHRTNNSKNYMEP